MKFTLDWLKSHLDTTASLEEICAALTDIGLEVEGIDDPAAKYAAFTIAHVTEAVKHPDADKLRVCTVETKDGTMQIVCGAPNARKGMTAVYAPVGAYVPGIDVTLSKAKIRGVESFGMLCSESELELSDEHDGIMDLGAGLTVGDPVAKVLGLTDPVIDIAITPDRADCLGVRGIARDLAARGIGTLKPYSVPSIAEDGPAGRSVFLDLSPEMQSACPYFTGRTVRGVKDGPSPKWMQARLTAIGSKPISALVDITNYVAFDLGQPLHAYDAAKVSGDIGARMAKAGGELAALNDKTYTLTADMTVIADEQGTLGLAGIMGGAASAVSDTTTDIFLEAAWFDPARTGHTGRALAIESDARYRFERGVNPAGVDNALAVATQLVLDICGGIPSQTVSAGTAPLRHHTISFDPAHVERLTGLQVEPAQALALLTALGFGVTGESAPYSVTVPEWRADVDGSADLVEEVMRLKGLDAVPTVALPRATGIAKPTLSLSQKRERKLRRTLAAAGLNEAITYAFIADGDAKAFLGGGEPIALANAISSEMTSMRPSLLPGLLRAAKRNLDRGLPSVSLFEIGRVFLGSGPKDQPVEGACVLAGAAIPRGWRGGAKGYDAFDAKSVALLGLQALGAPTDKLATFADISGATPTAAYHPGQAGELRLGPKNTLARFGLLHPKHAKLFGFSGPVAIVEWRLEGVPTPKAKGGATKAPIALETLQPVERDFAFIVKDDVPAQSLVRAVQGADKASITHVAVFDRYDGAGLEPGTVSLGICVTLQPRGASFTEQDLDAVAAKITAAAQKSVGATLRT